MVCLMTKSRTGRPLGSIFGYEADGLFQVSDDKNGDGVIDSKEVNRLEKEYITDGNTLIETFSVSTKEI